MRFADIIDLVQDLYFLSKENSILSLLSLIYNVGVLSLLSERMLLVQMIWLYFTSIIIR